MFSYEMLRTSDRPYVIAEIGSNHNGDINLAKKLINIAKDCGADCVKFQSWSKDTIFSRKVYDDNYFLRDDYRDRTDYTLESIVDKYSVGVAEHRELKAYCDEVGIDFASTGFSKPEIDLLADDLDVPFLKIASMDVTNHPLLAYAASKGKPIVISTGLSDAADICSAIDCLERNGCHEICILHCVSIYPPQDDQVNLNNIDTLRSLFPRYSIGYSDHTLGITAPIMSLAKNVAVIEKHFTIDHDLPGWDHKVSAEPDELRAICEAARNGRKMLGTTELVVSEDEERRNAFQRSIVAAHPIQRGDFISEDDIDYKRPGTGISPRDYQLVVGRRAARDIAYDEIITASMLA